MRALAWGAVAVAATGWGCAYVYPVSGTGKGCDGESAGYYPSREVVKRIAARDFPCPLDQVSVAEGGATLRATGCDRSAAYMCEDDAVSGCSLEDATTRESCRPLLK